MEEFLACVRREAGAHLGRPAVVALDGRGGAGKSTLAQRLHAVVPASTVVHTDDIAWHHSFFDWQAVLAGSVWVQSDGGEARRRALARDVEHGAAADTVRAEAFWDEWMAEEIPFFARDRPWDRAWCIVAGTHVLESSPEQVVVAARRSAGRQTSPMPDDDSRRRRSS